MATASKAKKATKKTAKKTAAKKPIVAAKLPEPAPVEQNTVLPRGQELLACGTIRLKTGDHDLGEPKFYDLHGARIKLGGRILVASKNVNWLSICKCQKCNTPRSKPVAVETVANQNGEKMVCISYYCDNESECQLGGRSYVAIYDTAKVSVGV